MPSRSAITWTQYTLSSLYGCNACSPGCSNCYARRYLQRFAGNKVQNRDGRFDGLVKSREVNGEKVCSLTGSILFNPVHLYQSLGSTPKLIFVNPFSDLLHENLPLELVIEHFRVFANAPQHIFQVLTKRGNRLAEVNRAVLAEFGNWPQSIWMGVSVCSSNEREMVRIQQLAETQAALRWVSFEPWHSNPYQPLRMARPALSAQLRQCNIGWIVVGGESGGREDTALMTLDDARFLVQEGKAAGCRTFFKQLGTALAIRLDVYSTRGKGEHRSQGAHPDQWPADLHIQEYPDLPAVVPPASPGFRPSFDAKTWKHFTRGMRTVRGPSLDNCASEGTPDLPQAEDQSCDRTQ